jgi:hypothetical protein
MLREGHRFRVFENGVLRRISGAERKEGAGDWRRLHEELHNLYITPNIIRVINSRKINWYWDGGDKKCIQDFGQKT